MVRNKCLMSSRFRIAKKLLKIKLGCRPSILCQMYGSKKAISLGIPDYMSTSDWYDFTPKTIEERTKSYKGSLYGTSSNNLFSAFLRHPNFSRKIQNLYFCGGSVHPGGGIPLALKSGINTAKRIMN